MDEQHELVDALRRLVEEGGSGNFLVVEAGDYYLQVAAGAGHPIARLEAVSNAYLPEDLSLDEDAEAALARHGFSQSDKHSNWAKEVSIAIPAHRRAIAYEILNLLRDVYRVETAEAVLDLNLEDSWQVENPKLRKAIVSGDSLFDAMGKARVLVPIASRTEEGEDLYHHDEEGLVVFTEQGAFDAWNRGHRDHHDSIVCLLPVAARLAGGVGVSVNPGGGYSFSLAPDEAALLIRRTADD